jgi:hypothetical protein
MEFIGQVLFGAVMVIVGTVLFAVPGFAAGGAIGLLARRFVSPTRRVVACVVGGWVGLCMSGTLAVIIQTEASAQHGSLDAFGEMIVGLLGFASALGGS